MHFYGVIIAVICFVIIGVFHPIVIRSEYYFSAKCWPVFLLVGVICLIISLRMENILWAAALGVLGCTCLWSILELKEQEERVRKGWFPANPKREKKEEKN